MSGEAGGGAGIESGGTGVAVLEPPKPPPVAETPMTTEAPSEHIDEPVAEEVLDSTVDPKADPKLDTPTELDSVDPTDITETPSVKDISETGSPPISTSPDKEHTGDTPEGGSEASEEKPEKIERNATSEVVSTKEMLRQKLTHDFIKASETDPEKKSESVIKGDLETNRTKLTPEQIELLEIYRKQATIDPEKPEKMPSDEHVFQLVDKVRDQIAKEALGKSLLSGSHLLPLVDEKSPLYKKLQETAFIDDPKLLIEVFGDPVRVALELAKIQMKINEIKDDPDSHDELIHLLELDKLLPKVIKDFPKILESQNITDLFKDIAEGLKPELVRGISEFSQDSSMGLTEILKELLEESGVKIDPNKLQKGFKKYGTYGIFATLGLIYALMKSGKEQPQGYQ